MKIISWNVNGARSVFRNGFWAPFLKHDPDIICLQEIKAHDHQLPDNFINSKKYHSFFNCATKKGYSGVAVFSKTKPLSVKTKLGEKTFDFEGRFLELKYKNLTLINIYLPHGGRQKEKLDYKLRAYKKLINHLAKIKNDKVIIVGDFNIAHEAIDLERPKSNKDNIMFTPEERKRIGRIINLGFVDTFRHFHKTGGNYTWWPYMANARARNLGWRIDYGFVSSPMRKSLKDGFILNKVMGSDHCPIGIKTI